MDKYGCLGRQRGFEEVSTEEDLDTSTNFPLPTDSRLVSIHRRFGTKCAGCAQGISPSDLVRKARSKVFHLNCFTCMVCNKQLSTGEELYVIDENKFVCKDDYLSSSSLKEGSLNSGTQASALPPASLYPAPKNQLTLSTSTPCLPWAGGWAGLISARDSFVRGLQGWGNRSRFYRGNPSQARLREPPPTQFRTAKISLQYHLMSWQILGQGGAWGYS